MTPTLALRLRRQIFRGSLLLAIPLTLTACAFDQKSKSIDLSGVWQSDLDATVMSIEPSGLFTLELPDIKTPAIGTVSIDGNRATFRNRAETKICVGDVGTYDANIDGNVLTFMIVRDTCEVRADHMLRPWRRAAKRAG